MYPNSPVLFIKKIKKQHNSPQLNTHPSPVFFLLFFCSISFPGSPSDFSHFPESAQTQALLGDDAEGAEAAPLPCLELLLSPEQLSHSQGTGQEEQLSAERRERKQCPDTLHFSARTGSFSSCTLFAFPASSLTTGLENDFLSSAKPHLGPSFSSNQKSVGVRISLQILDLFN